MEIPPSSTREEAAEEDFGAAKAPSVVVGILRNVWAKRGFLGKATFGGLAAGALVALLIPSRYQATAQLLAELSTSAAHRERVFLEERLRSVKQDLDDASQKFSQFESTNKTIDIKEQARAMVQGAAAIEGELIATESELKGLEEIYTTNNVRVRAVQARIGELRRQLDKLGGGTAPEMRPSQAIADAAYPTIRL